jgi:hypothetical protein
MKRFVLLTIGVIALTLVSLRASEMSEEEAEQLTGNCGEVRNRNNSYQFGNNLWLEYIVETARSVTTDCPWLSVTAEAWVSNAPGSSGSKTDLYTASLRRQVPVPHEGFWHTGGRHYRNYFGLFSYVNGETSSTAEVRSRSDESPGEGGEGYGGECGDPESPCDAASSNGGDSASPIILDVARDGYHLTSLEDGVFFDLDADGFAELVSWTRAQSDDAFLALDRNGNGLIDNGGELFGNHTPSYPGANITASNGFEALRFLEGPAYGQAARDEVLNEADAAFARLLLWTDRNHDGLSQPDELQSLRSAGVRAIGTDYKLSRRQDRYGNEFRQRARAAWTDGETFVFDVWLRRRP